MTNYQIADFFTLLAKLSDIHGENSFKVKSYSIAAFNIEKTAAPLAEMKPEDLYQTKGIGVATGKKIEEIIQTGNLKVLNELLEKTPPGILEMLQIKGLGPKKIVTIWKELEIESIGELLYACNENRLMMYKGFGEKNQQSIRESIEFYLNAKGSFLYARAELAEPEITGFLKKSLQTEAILVTGDFRRHLEIIDSLEYVIGLSKETITGKLKENKDWEWIKETDNALYYKIVTISLPLCFYYCQPELMEEKLFETSGSEIFVPAFRKEFPGLVFQKQATGSDLHIFESLKIQYIPPFLREQEHIISLAKDHKIPNCIAVGDIKGIIHSHSNWSDGANTIEEMAASCIQKGFEYLVISDHSKTAFYANGLTEERIREQHILIDQLNKKYAPFRIFKSIECDILNDGSLDYNDEVLSGFDLVIVSIHSNLKMTEEKAMQRLLTAVENRYTTILGHMTGRLLLSRPPYPVRYEQVIEACFENQVAIELNAHPSRLDIDWRQIDAVLKNDVLISIDPDAHSTDGFDDIRFGVLAAQKAMVQPHQNLSSFSLKDFEEYIFEVRERKMN